jgi:hypothetical protein
MVGSQCFSLHHDILIKYTSQRKNRLTDINICKTAYVVAHPGIITANPRYFPNN